LTGLLQRLVNQSRAASADSARIRPAVSTQAHAPRGENMEDPGPHREPAHPWVSPETEVVEANAGTILAGLAEEPRLPTTSTRAASVNRGAVPTTPPTPASASRSTDAVPRRAPDSARAESIPQRLLDEITPDPSTAMSGVPTLVPAPRVGSPRPPDAAQAPTEVHVHIGRVEVIAAGDPPAATRKEHKPRSARTLSTYLQGGRS
jgi:hypothetical protein